MDFRSEMELDGFQFALLASDYSFKFQRFWTGKQMGNNTLNCSISNISVNSKVVLDKRSLHHLSFSVETHVKWFFKGGTTSGERMFCLFFFAKLLQVFFVTGHAQPISSSSARSAFIGMEATRGETTTGWTLVWGCLPSAYLTQLWTNTMF